nr:polyribonucleotide nucleotidyltransferase [Saprospiraceae bacterium]
MGKKIPTTIGFQLPDGQDVIIETGKLATQAHGSVVVRIGDTMLFASVVSNKEPKPNAPFFPLSVDYQEKFASAGKIPGNFFRRETRLSDYEILICRLVDRAIRPLFPDNYMNETQVIINLISADGETMPDSYAALAASAALSVSDIPFSGPISEVRVAKINGQYVVNPCRSDLETATLDIIVAATMDNVMMVEGEGNEMSEGELIEAIKVGHEAIKVQCQAQLDLAQKVGEAATVKREVVQPERDQDLFDDMNSKLAGKVLEVSRGGFPKPDRKEKFNQILEDYVSSLEESKDEEYMEEKGGMIEGYYREIKKEVIRDMVLNDGKRIDGRLPEDIRDIWCEIDYLPAAHGSAIFNRGETQALASLTLGSKQDSQLVDNALDFHHEKFILHYNFPPYCTGEAKFLRGPSRREVGHANLAGRSIKKMLPDDIPYTMRIVSDVMESNGSSSMATVCASSLSLMDAGIGLKKPVAGIAMGLIAKAGNYAILSDILGDEDALGDMDFKVTGTRAGICGCQMDIKVDGLSYEVMEKALLQARAGREHILNEMGKVIEQPREDLKPHAPRVVELIIDKSFIGAVIGPGGKIIQEMQAETGAIISIEEVDNKGIVQITSSDKEGLDDAVNRIKSITHVPDVGDVYDARVASVMPYGVFVDFAGKSGLLHVSEFAHTRVENVDDVFSVGDEVKVKLIGIDPKSGKYKLSRKVLLPKPEGSGKDGDDRDRGGRGDRRDSGDRRR